MARESPRETTPAGTENMGVSPDLERGKTVEREGLVDPGDERDQP